MAKEKDISEILKDIGEAAKKATEAAGATGAVGPEETETAGQEIKPEAAPEPELKPEAVSEVIIEEKEPSVEDVEEKPVGELPGEEVEETAKQLFSDEELDEVLGDIELKDAGGKEKKQELPEGAQEAPLPEKLVELEEISEQEPTVQKVQERTEELFLEKLNKARTAFAIKDIGIEEKEKKSFETIKKIWHRITNREEITEKLKVERQKTGQRENYQKALAEYRSFLIEKEKNNWANFLFNKKFEELTKKEKDKTINEYHISLSKDERKKYEKDKREELEKGNFKEELAKQKFNTDYNKLKKKQKKEINAFINSYIEDTIPHTIREVLYQTSIAEMDRIDDIKQGWKFAREPEKRTRLNNQVNKAVEWYRKQPLKYKLALSLATIGLGISGAWMGGAVGTMAVSYALAGRTLLRMMGGALTTAGVEKIYKGGQRWTEGKKYIERKNLIQVLDNDLDNLNNDLNEKILILLKKQKGKKARRFLTAGIMGSIISSGVIAEALRYSGITGKIAKEIKDKIYSLFGEPPSRPGDSAPAEMPPNEVPARETQETSLPEKAPPPLQIEEQPAKTPQGTISPEQTLEQLYKGMLKQLDEEILGQQEEKRSFLLNLLEGTAYGAEKFESFGEAIKSLKGEDLENFRKIYKDLPRDKILEIIESNGGGEKGKEAVKGWIFDQMQTRGLLKKEITDLLPSLEERMEAIEATEAGVGKPPSPLNLPSHAPAAPGTLPEAPPPPLYHPTLEVTRETIQEAKIAAGEEIPSLYRPHLFGEPSGPSGAPPETALSEVPPAGVPADYTLEASKSLNSVWKMAGYELGHSEYASEFTGLDAAQKTYMIDAIKDKIAVNPKSFGLTDIDKLKIGQKVDFSSIFRDKNLMEEIFEKAKHLSEAQKESILKNNKIIERWLETHKGEFLSLEKVQEILKSAKEGVKTGIEHGPTGIGAAGHTIEAGIDKGTIYATESITPQQLPFALEFFGIESMSIEDFAHLDIFAQQTIIEQLGEEAAKAGASSAPEAVGNGDLAERTINLLTANPEYLANFEGFLKSECGLSQTIYESIKNESVQKLLDAVKNGEDMGSVSSRKLSGIYNFFIEHKPTAGQKKLTVDRLLKFLIGNPIGKGGGMQA